MKVHIVSHTHWDREWYRPFQYFKVRLSYFFDKLFSAIEENEDYKYFMLDGQMVMIEDYLNMKPENKEKIKEYVMQGRLIIGPWYSQPDEFAPDGEALIRNLLKGTNMALEYGEYMNVGYLPDSFGQSCQMPHILNGCGIKSACMMRGVPADKLKRTEFIWRGLNGDEVFSVALPEGYSNGMFLPAGNVAIDVRMKKIIHDIKKAGNKDNVLVMNGVDHQFPQPQIAQYIGSKSKSKYLHSTLEGYIEAASEDKANLVEVDGEMISPVTNRVHTSIASTRMYQKTKNRRMQSLLEKGTEPLCTMAWVMGADYPDSILDSAWKELFKNQAHDSICGCCTDEVHREIGQRFEDIDNMATTLKKMHARAIASAIAGKDSVLAVFNDSMTTGTQAVHATVFCDSDSFSLTDENGNEIDYVIETSEKVDAAAFSIWSLYLDTPCIVNKVDIFFELDFSFNYGYRRLRINEGKVPKGKTCYVEQDSNILENDYSVLKINNNGTFDLLDKESGIEYIGLNTIEDCGDAGDTYNYCPPDKDNVITSRNVKESSVEIKKSAKKATALIKYEMMVPESLSEDGRARSDKMKPMEVETEITLYQSLKRIDIRTKIKSDVKDHRVRALFPVGIESSFSYAETQFGTIRRNDEIKEAADWMEKKLKEKPLPIYSCQRFVDVNNGSYGLAVLNRGLTEYEIYNGESKEIAVTLLRGVGYLGKPDLSIRPGRPSGVYTPTPDAQCIGETTLEYSVLAHLGDTDKSQAAKHAAAYDAEASAVQNEIKLTAIAKKYGPMMNLFDYERLQDSVQDRLGSIDNAGFEFIKIDNDKILISALKKAEKEDAIILRVYNPSSETVDLVDIYLKGQIEKVYECDFLERNTREIEHNEGVFRVSGIKGSTAQTYKIIMSK